MSNSPSTILLYGDSYVGKSVQVREIALWTYNRTGLLTRAIIADSSTDPYLDLLISETNPGGIIQAFDIKGMEDPWVKLIKMSQGFTLRRTPKVGGGFNDILDPPKVKDNRILVGDRKLGQVVLEGLSTISSVLLEDHARHAKTRPMWGSGKDGVATFDAEVLVQNDPSKPPTLEKMEFGRAVGGHYGDVQRRMIAEYIPRFSSMEYVDRVVWTGHAGKGTDEQSGQPNRALGPATVGQASVDKMARLFAHVFHMESETRFDKDKNVTREYKAWFVDHPDQVFTNPQLHWPTKVSLSMDQSKELFAKFPKGYIPLTYASLGQYLDILYPFKEGSPGK